MSFFYTTEYGLYYFMALVIGVAVSMFGSGDVRKCSAGMVTVFLAERVLVNSWIDMLYMLTIGGLISFTTGLFLVMNTKSLYRLWVAVLFFIQLALYSFVIGSALSFESMALASELAGYVQIGIVFSGGIVGGNRIFRRNYRDNSIGAFSIWAMAGMGGGIPAQSIAGIDHNCFTQSQKSANGRIARTSGDANG